MNGVVIFLFRYLGVSKNINRLLFIFRGYECDLEVYYNIICKFLEVFFKILVEFVNLSLVLIFF